MKTNLDRLRQLSQMYHGEDVVENYNSSKTAKAEYNRMAVIWKQREFNYYASGFPGVEESARYFGTSVDEMEQLANDFRSFQYTTGNFSTFHDESMDERDAAFFTEYNRNEKDPSNHVDTALRHGFYYVFTDNKRSGSISGKFIAKYSNTTKTGRQTSLDRANELARIRNEQMGVYHVGSVYDARTMTKRDFNDMVHRLETAIANNTPIQPCSEKQAFWVAKKLGCPQSVAARLNIKQASQLLDVLFDKNGYYASTPALRGDILNHYSKILGLGVNEGMINRIVDNVLNEILHR